MHLEESERVEFKRCATERICKTVVAFANTLGGTIYIGIDDFGNVIGVDDVDGEMLKVTSLIHDGICPELLAFISIEAIPLEGRQVISVSVDPGDEKPYYLASKGLVPAGVFQRVGPASVPVDRRGIRRMIRDADGDSFETRHARLQNLTFDQVRPYFERIGIAFDTPQFKTLGLYAEDGFFSNLALLISDQCPYYLRCAVFNDDCGVEFISHRDCSGSILEQLDHALAYMLANNRQRSTFSSLTRYDQYDYPEQALREALTNVVLHQDYDADTAPLIKMYRNRFECISFGGLIDGISLEDALEGVSRCRNPRLMELFHRLGIIEAYGTGIQTMVKAYEAFPCKPSYSATGIFKVSLPNINTFNDPTKTLTANYGSNTRLGDAVPNRPDDRTPLNGRAQARNADFSWEKAPELLVEFAGSVESFSRPEAETVLHAARDVTLKVINGLIEEGALEKEGKARSTRYRLASRA